MWSPNSDHPLRRWFGGLTEQTFLTTLGVADPPLMDYLSDMMSRFISFDALFRLRNLKGKPLEEVVDMVLDALHAAGEQLGVGVGLMLAADRTVEPSVAAGARWCSCLRSRRLANMPISGE